ncbi:MAG: hypothetical protein DRO67_06890 [Candidatus Asgardarchaeum californiense]|nr:MAG: hypothetical protein DRO67_06890 [Candidatus Asgardarchaeum californiense]
MQKVKKLKRPIYICNEDNTLAYISYISRDVCIITYTNRIHKDRCQLRGTYTFCKYCDHYRLDRGPYKNVCSKVSWIRTLIDNGIVKILPKLKYELLKVAYNTIKEFVF